LTFHGTFAKEASNFRCDAFHPRAQVSWSRAIRRGVAVGCEPLHHQEAVMRQRSTGDAHHPQGRIQADFLRQGRQFPVLQCEREKQSSRNLSVPFKTSKKKHDPNLCIHPPKQISLKHPSARAPHTAWQQPHPATAPWGSPTDQRSLGPRRRRSLSRTLHFAPTPGYGCGHKPPVNSFLGCHSSSDPWFNIGNRENMGKPTLFGELILNYSY